MSEYVISSEELKDLQESASVAKAIKELASILSGRSQDLPHRFRVPAAFAEYMSDHGTNQSVMHYLPLYGSNHASPMQLQITTRPTQKILELTFQAADGMRLFTLELEYGNDRTD